LLRDRLIFLVSVLQPYSQGGMVIVLTSLPVFIKTNKPPFIVDSERYGYLILFPILTFVSQRQSIVDKKLSPLVFPLVSTDISPTLSIIWFILNLILAFIHYFFTDTRIFFIYFILFILFIYIIYFVDKFLYITFY